MSDNKDKHSADIKVAMYSNDVQMLPLILYCDDTLIAKISKLNSKLTDDIAELTDVKVKLTNENSKLTNENSKLTDEKVKLTDENFKLTDENSKLIHYLKDVKKLSDEEINAILSN